MFNPFTRTALIALAVGGALFSLTFSASAQCPDPKPVEVAAWLSGAYDANEGLMADSLRAHELIPTTEPYTALGYQHRGGGGGEAMHPTFQDYLVNYTDGWAVVDWVVLELRAPNDPGRMIASQSCLILRNGYVISAINEATGAPSFCVEAGRYHVALRHRNHLGVMTSEPVLIDGNYGLIDLRLPDMVWRGSEALKPLNADSTAMGLWPGDVTFDGKVKYTGSGNDRDPVLLAVGGSTPNNVADSSYSQTDVNLDALTKYTGGGNDRDPLLVSVGGSTPNKVREGYIPQDSLTLRPNVHVIDPLAWVLDTTLSDLDSGNVLVFEVSTDMANIDSGHVVVGGEYGGYLRRVVHVDSAGSTLTLTTEQGSFYDVFASGTLALETAIQTTASSFGENAGSHMPDFGASITFPAGLCVEGGLEDVDATFSGVLRQVGEITETPFGDVFSWEYKGSIKLHGTLSISVNGCVSPIAPEPIPLIVPIPFEAGIPVPVAPGVIIIVPVVGTFNVEAEVELQVQYGATYTFQNDFNLDVDGRVGVNFDNGVPQPILAMNVVSPSFDFNSQANPTATFSCELTGGVRASLKLYNVLGPYLSFGGVHSIEQAVSETTDNWNVEYKNAFKVQAGLEGDLWAKVDFLSVEQESPEITQFLWPGKLALVSDPLPTGQEEAELADPVIVEVSPTLTILGVDISLPPSEGVPVSFNVLTGGGQFIEQTPVLTDVDGRAEAHWILGNEATGEQEAQARVFKGDLSDIDDFSPMPLYAAIENIKMTIVSGDEQIGSVNSELLNPLVVRITNQFDEPREAYPVHFEVTAGNGTVSDDFVATSSEGLAGTMFTLGFDAAAQNKVKAYALTNAGDTIDDAPQYFKAFIDPDTMMYADALGNFQTGTASAQLANPLGVAVVALIGGIPREDVLVHYQVVSGGGSLTSIGVSTDALGRAYTQWTLGPDLSIRQHVVAWVVDVYGDTLRGGPLHFYACSNNPQFPTTAQDVDGNVYPLVQIGCQCWFQKNLKTTKYADGNPIIEYGPESPGYGYPGNSWSTASSGMFNTQGQARVYNWHAVSDPRNICPAGFHVSTDQDWLIMEQYLGMETSELYKPGLFAPAWYPETPIYPNTSNRGASMGLGITLGSENPISPPPGVFFNSSGFTAIDPEAVPGPGGASLWPNGWIFQFGVGLAKFWTATPSSGNAWSRHLGLGVERIRLVPIEPEDNPLHYGLPCRCVKN